MASLSLINFTCDFGCFLMVKDVPGGDRHIYTAHIFAGKTLMKNVGFIGWRGMVGSVPCNAWLKSATSTPFALSSFLFSAWSGCAVFWRNHWHTSGCFDLEALKALDIIVTCQGGDLPTKSIQSFVKADGKVTGLTSIISAHER